jgi:hypothetical protein
VAHLVQADRDGDTHGEEEHAERVHQHGH